MLEANWLFIFLSNWQGQMHPECESLTFVPHVLILFFLLRLLLYLFLSSSFSSSPSTALPLLLLSASCSKSILQQFGEHTVLSHSLWCVYDCLWAELCDSQQIDELHANLRLMCGLAEPKDMGFTRPVLAMWKCPGHCPGLWHNRSDIARTLSPNEIMANWNHYIKLLMMELFCLTARK